MLTGQSASTSAQVETFPLQTGKLESIKQVDDVTKQRFFNFFVEQLRERDLNLETATTTDYKKIRAAFFDSKLQNDYNDRREFGDRLKGELTKQAIRYAKENPFI